MTSAMTRNIPSDACETSNTWSLFRSRQARSRCPLSGSNSKSEKKGRTRRDRVDNPLIAPAVFPLQAEEEEPARYWLRLP